MEHLLTADIGLIFWSLVALEVARWEPHLRIDRAVTLVARVTLGAGVLWYCIDNARGWF